MQIKSIPETIKEIQESLDNDDYESAYQTARENLDLNKQYNEGEYVFKNLLEELLFQVLIKKEVKNKIPMILDYSTAYSNYGETLVHFNEIDDAKRSFKLSRNYNPINVKASFGLCEIAKLENDLDLFYKLTLESFKIAYYPEDLARSFRNLSWYFLRIAEEDPSIEENIKIPVCLWKISQEFDNSSDLAKKELDELESLFNRLESELIENCMKANPEECRSYLKKKGLPYQGGIEIITICKNLGFQLDESKKVVPALFYFNIAYGLTKDPDIKLVIDDLEEKIEKRRNE